MLNTSWMGVISDVNFIITHTNFLSNKSCNILQLGIIFLTFIMIFKNVYYYNHLLILILLY